MIRTLWIRLHNLGQLKRVVVRYLIKVKVDNGFTVWPKPLPQTKAELRSYWTSNGYTDIRYSGKNKTFYLNNKEGTSVTFPKA